jgi:predicted ATPase
MNSAEARSKPPMRLTRIRVDNFKSLVDFELQLAPFTCLIGLNGAGKSTVLQAVDFASRLFVGDIDGWLDDRMWKAADLSSKLVNRSNIGVQLWMSHGSSTYRWSGTFNRVARRCTQEHLAINGKTLFTVHKQYYRFRESAKVGISLDKGTRINFQYSGSLLSQLDPDSVPHAARELVEFMRTVVSLEALSPQQLRRRAERSGGNVGLGGEHLSAFVDEMSPEQRKILFDLISGCYPELEEVVTRSLRRGWKQLEIRERFGNKVVTTEARHINDGLLRLLAILAELLADSNFVLFDEIENGINPELVESLLNLLVETDHQVLVTTHSPMILNYLDDDLARAGVQYLYRTPEGFTRAVPFFSIPSVSEKLDVMGPGEAFVDTDLTRLQDEIRSMPAPQQDSDDDADSR